MITEPELQQKKNNLVNIVILSVVLVVIGALIGRTSAPIENAYNSKWAHTIDSLKLVNEQQKKIADTAKTRSDSLQEVLKKEKAIAANLYTDLANAKVTKITEHNKVLTLDNDDLIARFQTEIAKVKQEH